MTKIINFNTFRRGSLGQEPETKSTAAEKAFQNGLLVDFRKISPDLYDFAAMDPAHGFSIRMTLEQKETFTYFDEKDENGGFVPMVACDFSRIMTQRSLEKSFGDETLQSMSLARFQLKVLEQMLLFAENRDADHIMLTFSSDALEYREIYSPFATCEEETETKTGPGIEMLISTDVETYDELVDFMDSTERKFRQILWREQKTNPAFREYLKRHPLPDL